MTASNIPGADTFKAKRRDVGCLCPSSVHLFNFEMRCMTMRSKKQVPEMIAPICVSFLSGSGEYTCRSTRTMPTPIHPAINIILCSPTVSLIFTRIKQYITKVSLPVKGGMGRRIGYADEEKSGFVQRLKGARRKKEWVFLQCLDLFFLGRWANRRYLSLSREGLHSNGNASI